MASITSANAILTLSIDNLYSSPVQLQGFATDDIFDVDPISSAEVMMGIDGIQSAGFVNVPIRTTIALQADSPSNAVFDNWWNVMQQVGDVYYAYGSITLNSLGSKYALIKGVLVTYPPIANARRVLQPRRFTISWQEMRPQPTNAAPNN